MPPRRRRAAAGYRWTSPATAVRSTLRRASTARSAARAAPARGAPAPPTGAAPSGPSLDLDLDWWRKASALRALHRLHQNRLRNVRAGVHDTGVVARPGETLAYAEADPRAVDPVGIVDRRWQTRRVRTGRRLQPGRQE